MDAFSTELIAQLKVILWVILFVIIYGGPFVVVYLLYWILSLPMRRRERARLFLHLVELGTEEAGSTERILIQAGARRDRALGSYFYEVVDYLKTGMRLDQALERVPRLLPPELTAMLRVGIELGDIRRVLPACRQLLNDAVSQTRGALNYLGVLAFVILPALPAVFLVMNTFVLPKFHAIAVYMDAPMSPLSAAVFGSRGFLVLVPLALMLLFQGIIFLYAAGPRGRMLFASLGLARLTDRVLLALPWRRSRLHRDFTTMLALLLDAGVAEARALDLAARSTANSVFIERANAAAAQLANGAKLTDAVAALDDTGELRWRITNAKQAQGGFFNALRGWFELLDAKGFQQEQAAAQIVTSGLVIVNGAFVGLLVVAMFSVLVNLAEKAVLW